MNDSAIASLHHEKVEELMKLLEINAYLNDIHREDETDVLAAVCPGLGPLELQKNIEHLRKFVTYLEQKNPELVPTEHILQEREQLINELLQENEELKASKSEVVRKAKDIVLKYKAKSQVPYGQ